MVSPSTDVVIHIKHSFFFFDFKSIKSNTSMKNGTTQISVLWNYFPCVFNVDTRFYHGVLPF